VREGTVGGERKVQSIRQRLREVEMEAMDTHSALLDLRVEVAHCEGKKKKGKYINFERKKSISPRSRTHSKR